MAEPALGILVYPILYFDALIVKSREAGPVKNKAVYLALGVNLQGEKRAAGSLDRGHRRRQVLAVGLYRVEEPRRSGWLYRLCRWAQGTTGSD